MVKKAPTSKAQLIDDLKVAQTFKEKNSILKALKNFDANPRVEEVDNAAELKDISLKKYAHPQCFICYRCDHAKMSNMKAKWKLNDNVFKSICGSCFDHVTRCVIAYRDVPEHQKPKRCIHYIPKCFKRENTLR
eukprot:Filipodium_phascolosomae@DN3458_c0_g1_i1.p1